jgi:hypothetical protein
VLCGVVNEAEQHADHLIALCDFEAVSFSEQAAGQPPRFRN